MDDSEVTTGYSEAVLIAACRLLGAGRPLKRATDHDLAIEADYRLRAAREYLAGDDVSEQLRAFHEGALEDVQVEIHHRLTRHSRRRQVGEGMTREALERIRGAVGVQEYAQHMGTDLRPKGPRRWEGLCPFHDERTPSLSVWQTHFVCFGCGAKGDVYEFARLLLGMLGGDTTFRDAVRAVAHYAGEPDPTVPPVRPGRGHDL